MNAPSRNYKGRRRAMTLAELLIVLVILAVTTTIAMQSTSSLVDQARYDATIKTMQNLQTAIVGQPYQVNPDGSPLLNGFVADTGMLPSNGLVDLVVQPNNLQVFSLYSAVVQAGAPNPAPPPVLSPAGWNGPYLSQPFQANNPSAFLDGWGNPIILDPATGTLTSLGLDNLADGTGASISGYNKDIVFTLPTTTGNIQAQIQIQDPGTPAPPPRSPTSSDGTLTLYYIGPNTGPDSLTYPLKELFANVTLNSTNTVTVQPASLSVSAVANANSTTSIVLVNGSIGPRVLWVQATGGSAGTKTSSYTRITVRPTTNVINVVLQ